MSMRRAHIATAASLLLLGSLLYVLFAMQRGPEHAVQKAGARSGQGTVSTAPGLSGSRDPQTAIAQDNEPVEPDGDAKERTTEDPSVAVLVLDDETGVGLADARVAWVDGAKTATPATTDEAGQAAIQRLPGVGSREPISVWLRGYVNEIVPGPSSGEPLVVRLRRGVSISGVVRDDRGEPVAGARVVVSYVGASFRVWPRRIERVPARAAAGGDAITNARGEWEVQGLLPGMAFRVIAQAPAYFPQGRAPRVVAPQTGVDVLLVPTAPWSVTFRDRSTGDVVELVRWHLRYPSELAAIGLPVGAEPHELREAQGSSKGLAKRRVAFAIERGEVSTIQLHAQAAGYIDARVHLDLVLGKVSEFTVLLTPERVGFTRVVLQLPKERTETPQDRFLLVADNQVLAKVTFDDKGRSGALKVPRRDVDAYLQGDSARSLWWRHNGTPIRLPLGSQTGTGVMTVNVKLPHGRVPLRVLGPDGSEQTEFGLRVLTSGRTTPWAALWAERYAAESAQTAHDTHLPELMLPPGEWSLEVFVKGIGFAKARASVALNGKAAPVQLKLEEHPYFSR